MKKLLIAFGLIFALSSIATPIHAQTIDTDTPTLASIQATIVQLLMQEIAALEAQIAQLSSKVDTVVQNTIPVVGNTPAPQVASAPAPTTSSSPACINDGHGSINVANCVVVTPSTAVENSTTTFTITAAPYTFLPLQQMPGFTISPDNATLTYTVLVPSIADARYGSVAIALNDGLQDANGNPIPVSHPIYIPITQ